MHSVQILAAIFLSHKQDDPNWDRAIKYGMKQKILHIGPFSWVALVSSSFSHLDIVPLQVCLATHQMTKRTLKTQVHRISMPCLPHVAAEGKMTSTPGLNLNSIWRRAKRLLFLRSVPRHTLAKYFGVTTPQTYCNSHFWSCVLVIQIHLLDCLY